MKKLFLLGLLGFLPIFAMVKEEVEYTDEKGRVFPMLVLSADLTGDESVTKSEKFSKRPKLRRTVRSKKKLGIREIVFFNSCQNGNLDLVENAIENQYLSVHITNSQKVTPLHIAVENGHEKVAAYLLSKGACIDAKDDKYGETPLYYAVLQSDIFLIDLLCEAGSEIDIPNKKGNTPLHQAIKDKSFVCAQILLIHGAYVNAQNKKGNTPLHIIFQKYQPEVKDIVTLLLKNQADLNVRNKKNQTPRTGITEQAKLFLKLWYRKQQRNK